MQENLGININLLVHSLSNQFSSYAVEKGVFNDDLSIFDNIVLYQADADNKNHTLWVDRLSDAQRVYVTINEHDSDFANLLDG